MDECLSKSIFRGSYDILEKAESGARACHRPACITHTAGSDARLMTAALMALSTFNYVPLLMESGNDFYQREMKQKQA